MEFFSKLWEKIKAWREYSNYLTIGIVVFILGILFHFPLERFSSILTSTIQKETGYIVQVEKLSFTLPIGVTAQNVKIQPPPGAPPFLLGIEKLTVRPSVFALLTYPIRKSFGFSYKAVRGKETWAGSASIGREKMDVDVRVKNFEWTGSFPMDPNTPFAGQSVSLKTIVNLDLEISGKTVALQQGNLSEAEGLLEIHSSKTDIEAPVVKQLNMTDFTFESKLKKGNLDINKFNFTAPNLSAKSSGSIKIEPFFPNSKIKLDAQLKADPSDQALSTSLQTIGTLFNIIPASDGTITLKVNGPLNSPERLSIKSF